MGNSKFKQVSLFILIAISSSILIGCNGGKNPEPTKGYNVTYHAGNGHTINKVQDYTSSNVNRIDFEPSPDPDTTGSTEFASWYENETFSGESIKFPIDVTFDRHFYAKWNLSVVDNYTVNFECNGGSKITPYILNHNKLEGIMSEPITERKGYKFEGWYDNSSFSGERISFSTANPYVPSTKLTTLYAKWTKVAYTVYLTTTGTAPENFDIDTTPNTYKSKEEVEEIKTVPNTKSSCASFAGWYTTPTFDEGTLATFPYKPNETSNHLYAKFIETGVKVTLKDSGLEKEMQNCRIIPYMPEPLSNKPGYEFKGWCVGESPDPIVPGTNYYYEVIGDNDIILNAKWVKKTVYTIKFYDGAKVVLPDIEITHGGTIQERPNYTKDKFDFEGWYDNPSFTGDPIDFPYTFTADTDLNFYAKTTRSTCNINIYNIEDQSTPIKTIQNVKKLESAPYVTIQNRENDYKLSKYTYKKDNTDVAFSFDVKDNIDYIESDGSINFIANWDTATRNYKITIDYGKKDDGTTSYDSLIMYKHSIKAGEIPTISEDKRKIESWTAGTTTYLISENKDIPLYEGIKITANWKRTYRKDGLIVNRVNPVDSSSSVETIPYFPIDGKLSNIPLTTYENYTLMKFKVTHNNDSTTEENLDYVVKENDKSVTEIWVLSSATINITYYDGCTKTLKKQPLSINVSDLPLESRSDYVIGDSDGYYFEDTSTHNKYKKTDTITLTSSSLSLQALWTKNAFTVTYNYNYSECPNPYIVEHVTKLEGTSYFTPTREGFIFSKWTEKETGTEYPEGTTITKDVELLANWIQPELTYKVIFNVGSMQTFAKFKDGGREKEYELSSTVTMKYDEFPVCECEGNVFVGWYSSEIGGEKIDEVSYSSQTQRLYARFRPAQGYITVYLNIVSEGQFVLNKNNIILLTIKENTAWKDISSKIPEIEYPYDDGLFVHHWSLTKGGEAIDQETLIAYDCYVYAVNGEYVDPKPIEQKTINDFETDNWPTLCSYAEDATTSSSGIEKLKAAYNVSDADAFLGKTRTVFFSGGKYTVRVAGIEDDFSTTTSTSDYQFPLTFEFIKCLDSCSTFDDNGLSDWTNSTLRDKLQPGGLYYDKLQTTLKSHIKQTVKYTKTGESTTSTQSIDYLFVSSVYELGFTTAKSDNEFTYDYYVDSTTRLARMEKYFNDEGNLCNYYSRTINYSSTSKDVYYFSHDGAYGISSTSVAVGRPVAPFFCIGSPKSSS